MKSIPVRNPRNGQVDYQADAYEACEIEELAGEARAAQCSWGTLSLEARADAFQSFKLALETEREAIVTALSVDTGRYLLSKVEFDIVLGRIDYWCNLAPSLLANSTKGHSANNPQVAFQHQGLAYVLVGVISPWNFPLTLAMIDVLPALMAGSAVILKPSEVTPRFIAPLQRALAKVPALAAVLKIISGGAETGRALVEVADTVCFTGSVNTGKKVAMQAAGRLIPAFLELGGKDPAIVLASADINRATDAILRSAAGSAGQACMSIERIFVDREIYPEFLTALTNKAKAVQLNFPNIRSGHIGPLIFDQQAKVIETQLNDALAKGAELHCGGKIEHHGGGLWCLPTVLTKVNEDMLLMREETFGPILPIVPFDTLEQAIELANNTIFGLSAAVFAADQAEAIQAAKQIDAGAISVNDAGLTSLVHDVEKHAFRQSGLGGSRMGGAGLTRFYRKKALLIQEGPTLGLDVFAEENFPES